ncbi:hypothetical protein AB0F17_50360 [Nonomuraea sp. NPDC026600]|uniref:hypothetical protein n=1 Tax=Nonomuraea sp. NPDC026600 TaxID=3155363 RepID=UPI00340DCC85
MGLELNVAEGGVRDVGLGLGVGESGEVTTVRSATLGRAVGIEAALIEGAALSVPHDDRPGGTGVEYLRQLRELGESDAAKSRGRSQGGRPYGGRLIARDSPGDGSMLS